MSHDTYSEDHVAVELDIMLGLHVLPESGPVAALVSDEAPALHRRQDTLPFEVPLS